MLLVFGITGSSAAGQVFTTLAYFNRSNGARPYSSLVQGLDGNLYGTAYQAGAYGYGTVFRIATGGEITSIHSFATFEAGYPFGGLFLAQSGDFYGTTSGGGSFGTAFKISPEGSLTTLYDFCLRGPCTGGEGPADSLVQTQNGNLYGTTYEGGADGFGEVFVITPDGNQATLHNFTGGSDGSYPFAGVVQGTDGNLYGTTYGNTVFKITPGGILTTIYQFCLVDPSCSDGANPAANLIQGADGNFYGTTYGGGTYTAGTVFRITPAGTLTTLYSFCNVPTGDPCRDGDGPRASLIQATDGNFYGTTMYGGAHDFGTIFKITSTGELTTLHSFQQTGGSYPQGGLFQGTDGSFYGTTSDYGLQGAGTVFRVSTDLGAFVYTLPASGTVGAAIEILGTDLAGATGVTFNGVPAIFTVARPTELIVNVPAGATSGSVQVVTPGGTLSSNVPFRVR